METWVVCPKHLWAYVGEPGEKCFVCGSPMLEAPLVEVRKPQTVNLDSRTRLCPCCKTRNVLYTFPGGFKSCADDACKVAAMDAAMEAE